MRTIKQPTIKQLDATNKVYQLRELSKNDNEFAELLQLSKVTLYTRLRTSNWTNPEIVFIEYLLNPEVKTLIDSLKIIKD